MTREKQLSLTLLSLLVLVLFVIGVFWGPRFLVSINPKSNYTSFKNEKTANKAISSVEVAEKAVALLEDKQTPETLKVAKEAVNRLGKNKEKASLTARISVIETSLKNKEFEAEAERAVVYLEGHADLSNVSLAQELVAKVTDSEIKKRFEERIRVVQESLSNQINHQEVPVTGAESAGESNYESYIFVPTEPSVPSTPESTPADIAEVNEETPVPSSSTKSGSPSSEESAVLETSTALSEP